MKHLLLAIFGVLVMWDLHAQYYLRGEIRDEKQQPIQNVRVKLHSDGVLYYAGHTGGFGIPSGRLMDSITLSAEGYEALTIGVNTREYVTATMKALSGKNTANKQKLISITKDQTQTSKFGWTISDESYFSLVENEQVPAERFPNTSFSLNINKASYSNIRRFLNNNSLVPPDAVRIEELLNYFNLNYQEPPPGEVFKLQSAFSDCPWDKQKKLMYLNIHARKLDLKQVPPSNLVFLIDASGSMDMPNRLPLVKAAFQMLVKNLRPIDTVSIVVYGGMVAVWMQPTSGAEKQKIIKSIEELVAQGDTPGESAIRMAYRVAKSTFIPGGTNRVILATDGDFNVGETSEKALEELITRERQTGVYLTCLGVGMGNFKDSKLETLAKRGNGNYAYLDDLREAEKVLVQEVTQTFYSVADDVFLNVHFNPSLVKQYRLVGFDNKRAQLDEGAGELEGGEIGSGNSLMAIFEVEPNVSDSVLLRQQSSVIADVQVKYTLEGRADQQELRYDCPNNYQPYAQLDAAYRFATAVTMFGLKLRESKFIRQPFRWEDIYQQAASSVNPNEYLQKEFLPLINQAKKVYGGGKKKRRSRDD